MIRIVTDTTCCVPVEKMKQLGVEFVPQIITFETTSFRDDYELSTEEFLEKLQSSKKPSGHFRATTSFLYSHI